MNKFGTHPTHVGLCPFSVVAVVDAVKKTVDLKPGWHTATINFELDKNGELLNLSGYKVSSFGDVNPAQE